MGGYWYGRGDAAVEMLPRDARRLVNAVVEGATWLVDKDIN
jgi:hypothetical protein